MPQPPGNLQLPKVLDRLGQRISEMRWQDVTQYGRTQVLVALVDTLGVAIAGSQTPAASIAAQALAEERASGRSLILVNGARGSLLDAGMLNGIAAHALDYDDGNPLMGGHPSALLVPAIVALADHLDAAGEEAMLAYAAGFEAIIRLSRGINSFHYEKGWHPTATIGVFGVAAAAAKLAQLNKAQTVVALSIAASMASGIKANFGTMTKPLHVGHAVRSGLLAARLASKGYTASSAALEMPQGFLELYNGAGNFRLEQILGVDDDPLEINRGYNPIKLFPCCASTHSAINAALEIRRDHAPDPANVARIQIIEDPRRMPHTDRLILPEPLSGKFSVQYVAARALVDGRVVSKHFEGDAHKDPLILALMQRTTLEPAPPDWPQNSFDARVEVTLKNGEKLDAFSTRRTSALASEDQFGSEELWAKFNDCAACNLPAATVSELSAALKRFERLGSVRSLTDILESDEEGGLNGRLSPGLIENGEVERA